MVALSLQSERPLTISGTDFFLRVLGGDFLITRSSPDGSITNLTHNDPVGGTFDSILPIDVDLIFTAVNNPANTFTQRFIDTLVGNGIPWSHTAPVGDPHNALFPAGNFFPCVTGAARSLCIERDLSGNEIHIFTPSVIPEPPALLLLGFGLIALAALARKTVCKKM